MNSPLSSPRDLRDLLADRAARSPSALDLDEMLAHVRTRAGERARRTRNVRAAGGGAFGIAAVVALVVAVLPSGGPGDQSGGGSPSPSVPPATSSAAVPSGSAAAAARSAAAAARSAAASRAAARSAVASRAAARLAADAPRLVTIVSTPAKAEASIGLVPRGWVYVGHQGPTTGYGPRSERGSGVGDFTNKITVDVHLRLKPDGRHPLRIAGYRASYTDSDGVQSVDLIYSDKVDIDIQIWSNAHTTRAQALRIARTIDIRSVKITSKG